MRDVLLKIWKEWVSELAPLFSLFWHLREAGASGISPSTLFYFLALIARLPFRTTCWPKNMNRSSLLEAITRMICECELELIPTRESMSGIKWLCDERAPLHPLLCMRIPRVLSLMRRVYFYLRNSEGASNLARLWCGAAFLKQLDTMFKSYTLLSDFVVKAIPCLDMKFWSFYWPQTFAFFVKLGKISRNGIGREVDLFSYREGKILDFLGNAKCKRKIFL